VENTARITIVTTMTCGPMCGSKSIANPIANLKLGRPGSFTVCRAVLFDAKPQAAFSVRQPKRLPYSVA
jgi:hypothetical protein